MKKYIIILITFLLLVIGCTEENKDVILTNNLKSLIEFYSTNYYTYSKQWVSENETILINDAKEVYINNPDIQSLDDRDKTKQAVLLAIIVHINKLKEQEL